MAKAKTVTMTVTVSVPGWVSASMARKEVRTRINDLTTWGFEHEGVGGLVILEDWNLRVRSIKPPGDRT